MNVDIYTEALPPSFRWDPKAPWRGTEQFYVETAKHLALLGHSVNVFYDGKAAVVDGVHYIPRGLFFSKWQENATLLACNSHPDPQRNIPYARRVRWSNFNHDRLEHFGLAFDAHVVLSEYHRKQFGGGVVIGHGCDGYSPGTKENVILFSSSPDRGADFLKGIAGRVFKETGFRFEFGYTGLPESDMRAKYESAKVWVHPGLGVELFCISALKAQAAGCVPVVIPNMALKETVRVGVFARSLAHFEHSLIDLCKDSERIASIQTDLGKLSIPSWTEVTKKLEILCATKSLDT
jgi:glycosyltransferase involved in cell wall biosynthesis